MRPTLSRLPGSLAVLDRFYCPDRPVDGRATLAGDEARHLIRVRRVVLGESVELFDGKGSAVRAEVVAIGRDRVELIVLESSGSSRIARRTITLASAVPKGDRFDWLVEKATELGVDRLIPLVTDHSVVDPRSAKLDRLRRVVIEASKQSRRDRLMVIDPPIRWASLLQATQESTRLIAHPGAQGMMTSGLRLTGESVILAIGPEGGFSDSEVDQAVEAGWQAVGLGSTILRVETAGLAGCSTLLALLEVVDDREEA